MSQVVFVIITANILILLGFFHNYVNPRAGRWWLLISIVVISILFALIVPKGDYDLARHYINLEKTQQTGMGLLDYVFHGAGELVDSNYRSMYAYNVITYLIAMFFPKETLPLLAMLVCYGIFAYILVDVQKRVQMSGLYIAASILLSNCLLPVLYVYSGVRNEMAVAIMGLAVYRRIYKNSHLVSFLILSLIAGTLHPIALVAIPFVLLSRIRPGIIGIILAGAVPFAMYQLMEVFSNSGIDFLYYIGAKFWNYTYVYEYYQGRFFYIAPVVLCALLAVLSLFRARYRTVPASSAANGETLPETENQVPRSELSKWLTQDQRMVNFVSWYSIFCLGNFRSYQIAMRLPYLLGILAPVIVYTFFRMEHYKEWKSWLAQGALAGIVGLSVLALVQNYLWMA